VICPIFCTIDKEEGVVKGKDILNAATSNAEIGGFPCLLIAPIRCLPPEVLDA
jgi:hypothetical protein